MAQYLLVYEQLPMDTKIYMLENPGEKMLAALHALNGTILNEHDSVTDDEVEAGCYLQNVLMELEFTHARGSQPIGPVAGVFWTGVRLPWW